MSDYVTPRTAACQALLSFTISWSLFSFMSIELVMPFNNLICRPHFLLPSIFPMAAVTVSRDFGARENKSVNASTVSPSMCHAVVGLGASLIAQLVKNPPAMQETPCSIPGSDGTRCHDLSFFECWVSSQLFHSPLLPSSRISLVPLYSLPLEWYHLRI